MMDLETVRERLQKNLTSINQRIEEAASKSQRSRDEITLVAVTKYVDAAITRAMVQCDQFVLGESRPQILWNKAEELSDEKNIQWHLIGHLQRNKARRTVPYCRLIHSVDSLRLLDAIDSIGQEIDRPIECLIEVNVSGEAAKHGFSGEDLEATLSHAAQLKAIQIKGLMAMASLHGDADHNRKEFEQLRKLRDKHAGMVSDNIQLNDLSMGMSGDFEAAIEEGATIVRIGSVLFDGVRS